MKKQKGFLGLLMLMCMFNLSQAQSKNTKVIAHRGAWKTNNLPQNSLASLNKAIELGCYGSEFDVYLTKDDVLVVNHDRDFYGIDIENATYQELLKEKHPNGESIPTAEAYIMEGLKQKGEKKTRLIFELKPSKMGKERVLEAAKKSIALVKRLKAEKLVDFITFDDDAGRLLARMAYKKADIAYLNGNLSPEEAKKAGYTGLDYHLKIYQQHPDWIKQAQNLGLTVNSWTVNKKEDMLVLMDQKIDFITTDEPELALKTTK